MSVMNMKSRQKARRKKSELRKHQSVSRRDFFAGAAATLACALVPASSLGFVQTPTSAEVFTHTQRKSLEAMVSRIIPADANGPGALEAGCARYIEGALAEVYRSSKNIYIAGLTALDLHARKIANSSFAALDPVEQDKILATFEQNIAAGSFLETAHFFGLVRQHTFEGMFGDPLYGGNVNFVGWDLIGYPGPRLFVSPEMQRMDAKAPRSRMSVNQLMHDTR